MPKSGPLRDSAADYREFQPSCCFLQAEPVRGDTRKNRTSGLITLPFLACPEAKPCYSAIAPYSLAFSGHLPVQTRFSKEA